MVAFRLVQRFKLEYHHDPVQVDFTGDFSFFSFLLYYIVKFAELLILTIEKIFLRGASLLKNITGSKHCLKHSTFYILGVGHPDRDVKIRLVPRN